MYFTFTVQDSGTIWLKMIPESSYFTETIHKSCSLALTISNPTINYLQVSNGFLSFPFRIARLKSQFCTDHKYFSHQTRQQLKLKMPNTQRPQGCLWLVNKLCIFLIYFNFIGFILSYLLLCTGGKLGFYMYICMCIYE